MKSQRTMGNSLSAHTTILRDDKEYTLDDVPTLLEVARSQTGEQRWMTLSSLESVRREHPEEVAVTLEPFGLEILSALPSFDEENTITTAVQLICGVMSTSPTMAREHIADLIPYVAGPRSNVSTQNEIFSLLDDADDELLESVQPRFAVLVQTQEYTQDILSNFYTCALFGRQKCTNLLIQAGAFPLALASMSSSDAGIFAAAVQILAYFLSDADFQAQVDSSKQTVIQLFVSALPRNEACVSEEIVPKLSALEDDDDKALLDDNYWLALVLRLQYKEVFGCAEEWALAQQTDQVDSAPVVKAFKTLWTNEVYPVATQIAVARAVAPSFVGIRKAAVDAGLLDVVRAALKGTDEGRAVAFLDTLREMTSESQQVGAAVLDIPGYVDDIVLATASLNPEIRHPALRALAHICDAFTENSEELRGAATAMLSSSSNLPVILDALGHDHKQTAGHAASLLGEMCLSELGTEEMLYDEEAVGATPLKDKLFTPDFVRQTVGLLHHAESAPGAFYLLAYGCRGYPRLGVLLKDAFAADMGSADAVFFARLTHDGVRGREMHTVRELALSAGAMGRLQELLKDEKTTEAKEGRDFLARGLANFNECSGFELPPSDALAGLLTGLLVDESEEAMDSFLALAKPLSEAGPDWVLGMEALGSREVVQSLASFLRESATAPTVAEPSDTAGRKERRKYEEAVSEAEKMPKRILEKLLEAVTVLLPVLQGGSSALAPALLSRYDVWASGYLDTVEKLAALDTSSMSAAIQDTLLSNPQDWDFITQAGDNGLVHFGQAILRSSASSRLLKDVAAAREVAEESGPCVNPQEALCALSAIVKVAGPEAANIKKAFAEDKAALDGAVWLCTEGESDVALSALYSLCGAEAAAVEVLEKPELFDIALRKFGDPVESADASASVLGWFCDRGEERYRAEVLKKVEEIFDLRMQRALLENKDSEDEDKDSDEDEEVEEGPQALESFDLWSRMEALASTTPGAQRTLMDARCVDEAVTVVNGDDEDGKAMVVQFLRALVEYPEDLESNSAKFAKALAALEAGAKDTDEAGGDVDYGKV
ncbi:ARM repeat-containing protein [Cylindrobasidium torrendii FP15055 ss-10]|uniref:ARM repeat-containing protein n=1 Tax=Cylindrobasidium torrendii FP15055 ss-10 TaxID=1314674 RepID=A0A0D7BAB3_9AGAR|nr:ARM repeat-containing protein [Cylindrobasidium torrendii FP15055 ss-10]